jgi:hypothetical protein
MNRAQRRREQRQHLRRHCVPQRSLVSDHGRAVIVYDEVTDLARAVDLEFPDALDHVFPGLTDASDLWMLPGVSPSHQILGWARDSIAEIRALGAVDGSRVMVSAWCEHIRDEAAARFPFGGSPLLAAAFAQHPTAWFVVATMPRAKDSGT